MRVPRIDRDDIGEPVVTGWGAVLGMTLRAGDRLLLADGDGGGLLLLEPRGRGRPMLGRWAGRTLLAEPGGVPALEARWSPVGTVVAVERELDRGVLDGRPRHVVVDARRVDDESHRAWPQLSGGPVSPAALDALCLRAAVLGQRTGAAVALAAADTRDAAEAVVEHVRPGHIRYVLSGAVPAPGAQLIVGPWVHAADGAGRSAEAGLPAHPPGRVQLRLFGDIA